MCFISLDSGQPSKELNPVLAIILQRYDFLCQILLIQPSSHVTPVCTKDCPKGILFYTEDKLHQIRKITPQNCCIALNLYFFGHSFFYNWVHWKMILYFCKFIWREVLRYIMCCDYCQLFNWWDARNIMCCDYCQLFNWWDARNIT